MKPETMMIDDVKYVREDSISKEKEIVYDGDNDLCNECIGKKVICRSRNEGVNVGIVSSVGIGYVVLKNARRLYYHKPRVSTASWYEGVANYGVSDDSKLSPIVSKKTIVEDYSLTECAQAAYNQIMEVVSHGS